MFYCYKLKQFTEKITGVYIFSSYEDYTNFIKEKNCKVFVYPTNYRVRWIIPTTKDWITEAKEIDTKNYALVLSQNAQVYSEALEEHYRLLLKETIC